MLNPYQAPAAEQLAPSVEDIDLSSEWSVELAFGRALTLAGERTGLLALLAAIPAGLGVANVGLNLLMTGAFARGDKVGLVTGGACLLALVALALLGMAVQLISVRVWLALLRNDEVVWWSLGRFALVYLLFFAGQTLYTVATVPAMVLVVPFVVMLACTHVWVYALVDGDDLIEAFKNSWTMTRHGWVRLFAWFIAFYGLSLVAGLLSAMVDSVAVQLVCTFLFAFVHSFVLEPTDVAIYVQMRKAFDRLQ